MEDAKWINKYETEPVFANGKTLVYIWISDNLGLCVFINNFNFTGINNELKKSVRQFWIRAIWCT